MLRNSPEITDFRNSPPEVFWKYAANLQENTQCGSVISIKLQNNFVEKKIFLNHTSVWVLSCKFAEYFQNTFS